MRLFKIRCSQIGKIMGAVGLTGIQETRLSELLTRRNDPSAKPLTVNMEKELAKLANEKNNPELPETCKSYLMEWFADEQKSLHSKYIDKGVMCEHEAIQFMAQVLEFGVAEKNVEQKENDFLTGCCDVNLPECIVDTKCSWDKETLQANVLGFEKDYEWQGIGYCILYKKKQFILFHGLFDTDESINFNEEVIYSDLPDSERWIAYQWNFTDEKLKEYELAIYERVAMCREWLREYDKLVRSKMGKLNIIL